MRGRGLAGTAAGVAVAAVAVSGCGLSQTTTVAGHRGSLGEPIGSVQGSGSAASRPASPASPRPSPPGTPPRERGPDSIQLPPAPSRTAPRSRAIVATASRFATAYLRYQIGRDPPAVQRAIRATCTPGFAHRLLSEPVSLPNGLRSNPVDQPSRLDRVRYTGPASLGAGPPVGIVLARYHTIRHPGVGGVLTIQVAGTGSSWRVTGLT